MSMLRNTNCLMKVLLLLLCLYSPLLGLGRFFSLLILYIVGRTPWTRYQPIARPIPTHRMNAHTDNHASSEIQTHDPSVRANEDSSCLTPHGHCVRLNEGIHLSNASAFRNSLAILHIIKKRERYMHTQKLCYSHIWSFMKDKYKW
jgi:hypothetical protein